MTPKKFKDSWTNIDKPLSPLTRTRLDRFGLRQSTIEFLVYAGLPTFCEPNLQFANDSDDIIYGINKLTEQFDFEERKVNYEKYVVIGSCCDGDAIAIDTNQNDIVLQLDHEDSFESHYFNSSLYSLADFIILNRDFEIEVLLDKKIDDRTQIWNFTNGQFNNLKYNMEAIDQKAVAEIGFWNWHLDFLLSIRREYFGLTL